MRRLTPNLLRLKIGSMSDNNRILFWIIAAVFLWGTVLAVGAYRYNFLPARFFVVIACVNGFLAFWLILLWSRRGRATSPSARDENSAATPP